MHIFQQLFAPVSWHLHPASFFGHILLGLLFIFALLAALQAAPRRSRKTVIAIFTFLGGLYFVTEFFWPTSAVTNSNPLTPFQPLVANISAVVGSFAIGLGVVSLVQLHSRNISRQRSGWGFSVVLLVSFVAMTLFGLMNEYRPAINVIPRVPGLWAAQNAHGMFQFLFTGGLTNLTSATFSIIAFYIASAAYRAFRIRSLEATLLMVAALIVMLGSVSFGTWFTHTIPITLADGSENPWANFRIENIAQWLLMEVNTAAQRGILFGLTLGLLATSLRYWLSLERGAYFDKEL
ncbi:MAG: hypothetical protein ACRYFS_24990 [Janthinobacterium lividum]